MEHKQIASRLAERTGIPQSSATAMIEAVGSTIAAICADLDSVAIPGFGTFSARKEDEHIALDPLTMKRTMYPPAIRPEFRPSVVLRHQIEK